MKNRLDRRLINLFSVSSPYVFINLLFICFLVFTNYAEAQTYSFENQSHNPIQIQNQYVSIYDTSIQMVHPGFRNKLIHYTSNQEKQNGTNHLKSANNAVINETILLQNSNFKISYQFELYDTTLIIKFISTFEVETSDNFIWFKFDVNSNGKVDSLYDKSYSADYRKFLCTVFMLNYSSSTYCGVCPSKAWVNYNGNIKSIDLNIPVKEIAAKDSITFKLCTKNGNIQYYWWPDAWSNFNNVYKIAIPKDIPILGTVVTKGASEIKQNSVLLGSTISSTANNVINESGFVWAKNELLNLENNLGKIINNPNSGECNARLNGLASNSTYYYRAYALINNVPIYGKLNSFRTAIDNTQFTYLDSNVVISNSGKNVIMLVSEEDFNKFRILNLDLKSLSTPLYSKFKDDFDFVFLIANSNEFAQNGIPYGVSYSVSNNVKGIGKPEFDYSNYYGSSGRLKSFIWLPIRSLFKTGPTLHEMMHTWANFLFDSRALVNDNTSPTGLKEIKYGAGGGAHWGVSTAGGQLGGFEKLITNVDGESNKYQGAMNNRVWSGYQVNANGGNGLPYSNLELYLMGLIPPEEFVPVKFFYKLSAKSKEEFFYEGKFYSDSVVTFDVSKITETAGSQRIPDYQTSQKEFSALVVLVSRTMPTTDEIQELDNISDWFSNPNIDNESLYNFYEATQGKATINMSNNISSIKPASANAGSDQLVAGGTIVTLNGSVSNAIYGKSYTYKWTAPPGILLSSVHAQNPTFTAPEVTTDTQFTISLVVNDGTYDLPADQVVISVRKTYIINNSAGNLAANLKMDQLSNVFKLILTGTIDARDFKTMRDNMPELAYLDLSGATIVGYSGAEGTRGSFNISYPANAIPEYAFYDSNTFSGKTTLISFIFPLSATSIGNLAFCYCSALTSITIPNSVASIGGYAFFNCTGLGKINANTIIPADLSGSPNVFYNVNKTTCTLHVPLGSKTAYQFADQWKDFLNIIEMPEESIVCHTLKFKTGWNIFSVPNKLDQDKIETVFQPCITNNSLIKIQDEEGNSMEDWGIYGGWKNNIGNVSPTEGYKVKLSIDDNFEICGAPVQYPFAIPLKSGWNIMGYPQTAAYDGLEVIQQLIDKGKLLKVQDEAGNSIEDWGIYGGWKNNIYDFVPGKGYNIKLSADDTLWINESYTKSSAIQPEVVATNYFKSEFEGNGLDHMNINLIGLPVNILKAGDELAIYDGATCVGAVTIMSHHLQGQTVAIAASTKDIQGIPGFTEGNPIKLKLWDSKQNTEYTLEPEIVKGSSTFTKHETTFASLEKYSVTGLAYMFASEQPEINCYPNPFSDEVTIEIILAKDSEVKVEVLNQLGQRVRFVQTSKMLNSGIHRLTWDGKNANNQQVAPGIYHLQIGIDESIIHRKIVLSK